MLILLVVLVVQVAVPEKCNSLCPFIDDVAISVYPNTTASIVVFDDDDDDDDSNDVIMITFRE